MTYVIQPIDGIAKWHEVIDYVRVSFAVFAHPMNDEYNGFHISIGKPALVVNIQITYAFEVSVYCFHSRFSLFYPCASFLLEIHEGLPHAIFTGHPPRGLGEAIHPEKC
jgi:hypothetical protein